MVYTAEERINILRKSIKAKLKDRIKQKYKQTGTSNRLRDMKRTALAPGFRISKSGKRYYENRKNRSDVPGTRT